MKNQFHKLSLLMARHVTQCSISQLNKKTASPHRQSSRMSEFHNTDFILYHIFRTVKNILKHREDLHWMTKLEESRGNDIQNLGNSQFNIHRDCSRKIRNDVRDRCILVQVDPLFEALVKEQAYKQPRV